MDNKKIWYIFMATVVGIIIILLTISGVESLINMINVVAEAKGFHIVTMILLFVLVGIFGFIEYLLVKLLIKHKQ